MRAGAGSPQPSPDQDSSSPGRVVHCKRAAFDLYIGRPSIWGNPFIIGRDGDRAEVIQRYEQWIVTQPRLMEQVHQLHGKVLGCWCSPLACHGKVLVKLASRAHFSDGGAQ